MWRGVVCARVCVCVCLCVCVFVFVSVFLFAFAFVFVFVFVVVVVAVVVVVQWLSVVVVECLVVYLLGRIVEQRPATDSVPCG